MRQRVADVEHVDAEQKLREARRAAEKAFATARAEAFGKDSLFGEAPGVAGAVAGSAGAPADAASVDVPGLGEVPSGDAKGAWAHLRAKGGGTEVPALGGLLNGGGNVCFANSVLQVLLRLPAVALWLSHHAGACGAERGCATCELWLARLALGKLPAVRPLLVEQLGRFGLEAFAGGAQQDAKEFLRALLGQLRVCEVRAGRCVPWPGVGCDVTHVERLFGFVLEKRLRCEACGGAAKVRCAYSSDCVLHLPLPGPRERTRVWTTTELYFRRCAASFVDCDCELCEEKTGHREQECVLTQPNVLLLHVQRSLGESGRASRHPVQPEKVLTLPGHDRYELAAVVYHQGKHARAGHYHCVVLGHDERWWRFDDTSARVFRDDVERSQLRGVSLMVYTRPRGQARFARPGALMSAGAEEQAQAGDRAVAAVLGGWASGMWRLRAQTFLNGRKSNVDATTRVTVQECEAVRLRDGVLQRDAAAVGALLHGLLKAATGDRCESGGLAVRRLGSDFSDYVACIASMSSGRLGGPRGAVSRLLGQERLASVRPSAAPVSSVAGRVVGEVAPDSVAPGPVSWLAGFLLGRQGGAGLPEEQRSPLRALRHPRLLRGLRVLRRRCPLRRLLRALWQAAAARKSRSRRLMACCRLLWRSSACLRFALRALPLRALVRARRRRSAAQRRCSCHGARCSNGRSGSGQSLRESSARARQCRCLCSKPRGSTRCLGHLAL